MTVHRHVLIAVIGMLTLALALGTVGFDSASIGRTVSVSVTDHEHAFVSLYDPGGEAGRPVPTWVPDRIDDETPVTTNDTTARLFVVRNRFDDVRLRVAVTDATSPTVALSDTESTWLGPGRVRSVTGTVDCQGATDGPHPLALTVVVDSARGTVHAEIDYSVDVVCATGADGNGTKDAARIEPTVVDSAPARVARGTTPRIRPSRVVPAAHTRPETRSPVTTIHTRRPQMGGDWS